MGKAAKGFGFAACLRGSGRRGIMEERGSRGGGTAFCEDSGGTEYEMYEYLR